jgi:hypothetical protein
MLSQFWLGSNERAVMSIFRLDYVSTLLRSRIKNLDENSQSSSCRDLSRIDPKQKMWNVSAGYIAEVHGYLSYLKII